VPLPVSELFVCLICFCACMVTEWCFEHAIHECKKPFFQFARLSLVEDVVSSLPSPLEDDSLFVVS
jgi:hypothetical protein